MGSRERPAAESPWAVAPISDTSNADTSNAAASNAQAPAVADASVSATADTAPARKSPWAVASSAPQGDPTPRTDSKYRGPETFAWLSAHGGAGSSSLAMAGGRGVALSRHWPDPSLGWPHRVVLVCRTNTGGFDAASRLLHEWAGGLLPDLDVCALVAVADAPGRLPRALRSRMYELSGVVPHLHQLPWIASWRETPYAPDEAARKVATEVAAHVMKENNR